MTDLEEEGDLDLDLEGDLALRLPCLAFLDFLFADFLDFCFLDVLSSLRLVKTGSFADAIGDPKIAGVPKLRGKIALGVKLMPLERLAKAPSCAAKEL